MRIAFLSGMLVLGVLSVSPPASAGELAKSNAGVDPTRFLGDRTSTWGNTIFTEMIITKVTPAFNYPRKLESNESPVIPC